MLTKTSKINLELTKIWSELRGKKKKGKGQTPTKKKNVNLGHIFLNVKDNARKLFEKSSYFVLLSLQKSTEYIQI